MHLVLLVFLHLLNYGLSAAEYEYFISTEGSDQWDGTSEAHVEGTNIGPWQTLNHAVKEITQLRPYPPTADSHATIYLLKGTHYLTSTVEMYNADSYMTIKALHDNEEVAVSGGKVLDGEWEEGEGGVMTTTFEGTCGESFVGVQRLMPARSPNLEGFGYNWNTALPPYNTIKGLLLETETCTRNSTDYKQECPYEDKLGFVFEDEFSADWPYLGQTKVLVFDSGIAETAVVGNITGDKVFFKEPLSGQPVGNKPLTSGWRYLIFNNMALLDIPGECVCNEIGEGQARFSYIPPTGEEFENLPVVVSQINPVVSVYNVTDLLLEGITFQHASSGGFSNLDYGNAAALKIERSNGVMITDCKFTQTGMTGLFGEFSNNVQVTKSTFIDIGYIGVHFHDSNTTFDQVEGQTNILIDNNNFSGCGVSNLWQPNCVKVAGFNNITVRNNDIQKVAYAAIKITGYYNRGGNYWEDNGVIEPTREDYVIHIEYNYIQNYGLGILNDMGAIYIRK